jgi:electron-transferring-flavoprotein dehydrogenase
MTEPQSSERESMSFDVVIVGGGPAGLAAAIAIRQRALAGGTEVSVCLIDKGAEIGAHILSGAVIDPRALDELIPDWPARGAPLTTAVAQDRFLFLGQRHCWQVPNGLLPRCFRNDGNFIGSLGALCRWLAAEAEALGADIYPGFAAGEVLYGAAGEVIGVATGDLGRHRDGTPGPNFQRGMALLGKYTLFAEGSRGHLGKQLAERFALCEGTDPQVYGLGIKELWEIDAARHRPGLVVHTTGWPLPGDTYGGGFLYHYGERLVSVGLVVGMNYRNPYLSPFEEMQQLKTHPALRDTFTGGRRLAYGARALTAGGLQALPRLVFPGGALIGDEAGFLNAARIKGSHAAIKSGLLAAEACIEALRDGRAGDELAAYPQAFRASWLHEELFRGRNFKPLAGKGRHLGALLFGIDQLLLRGRAPWTLHHAPDHEALLPAAECSPIAYPPPDGTLSFDRLSSVYLSNTQHEEDQPCHLQLADPAIPVNFNLSRYEAPETRYCPAGVYEIVREGDQGEPRLQINAANCLHCKACDIKDPTQNIRWVAPQGGEGPRYPNM